jgi:hypothetical protein
MKKPIIKRVPPATAPTEKKIIFCISLYFSIPPVFSRQNVFFKANLNEIAKKRNFLEKIEDLQEREIFKTYLTTKIPKIDISREATGKTNSGAYLINRNLKNLVSEIMADYEAGILKVQTYTKPPPETQLNKKINDWCDKRNIPRKYPIKKPTLNQIVEDFRQKSRDIDSQKIHIKDTNL